MTGRLIFTLQTAHLCTCGGCEFFSSYDNSVFLTLISHARASICLMVKAVEVLLLAGMPLVLEEQASTGTRICLGSHYSINYQQ